MAGSHLGAESSASVLAGRDFRDGIDITAAQFYAHLARTRSVPSSQPARRAVLRLGALVEAWASAAGGIGGIEMLLVCGTSIEAIAEMEMLLAEHYAGTIRKTWLGPAIGANLGPAIAVALVARA